MIAAFMAEDGRDVPKPATYSREAPHGGRFFVISPCGDGYRARHFEPELADFAPLVIDAASAEEVRSAVAAMGYRPHSRPNAYNVEIWA